MGFDKKILLINRLSAVVFPLSKLHVVFSELKKRI